MNANDLYVFIKMTLVKNGNMSQAEAGRRIGAEKNNFGRKLKAGTIRALELVNLLNALGYSVYAEKDGEKAALSYREAPHPASNPALLQRRSFPQSEHSPP